MKKEKFTFQKTKAFLLMLAFVTTSIPVAVFAQDENPQIFALIEFMKVKQGDEGKYMDIELNYWKKIHQERINQGEIIRWVLYQVRFAGSNDEYNYVTATLVDDPNKLEMPFAGIELEKIFPDEDLDKISAETLSSRQLVKRNLIRMVSSVHPEGGPAPFQYLTVDFMKVKPGGEDLYTEMENNVWKPVHEEFIKDGSRVGWGMWQLIFPSGSGLDYQYATTNNISEFSKIGTVDYNGAFGKAHPGKDVTSLLEDTNNSRELVRSELWQVVDTVGK